MSIDEFMEVLISYIEKGNMVIFTGVGLSTASGIKDFRGKNGLYKENINAEEILSYHYFMKHPKEFYQFFRDKLINEGIKPNLMHKVIAELQHEDKVSGVITQNIDALDTMAGTQKVIEVHGNATKFYCMNCHKEYILDDIMSMPEVPTCSCKGVIRPDIVLYDELLDRYKEWSAQELISNAKSVLVLGSSLSVDPAASWIKTFAMTSGRSRTDRRLFIVNMGATSLDYLADYKYDGDIIEVAERIKDYQKTR